MNGVTDIRDISIDNGNLMHPHSTLDPEEFRRQGHLFVDFIADYYRQLDQYPVLSQVAPGYLRTRLPDSAPDHPEPLDAILHDVRAHIIPGLTHWQSPNYYAYFPSTSSTAGFLGEMLSVGFNVNGFLWHTSPAATELENIVMDWVAKILALPKSFHFSGGGGGGGVLHGTTGEAILCTLVAARDKALGATGRDRICDLVVYSSDQTHCSLKKAAQIAGVTSDRIRALPTRRSDAFALRSDVLRAAVDADVAAGLIPLYLCCTVGTTSTTAVDPLRALCAAAEEHGIWVHVDAAYAGSACICPEFRHFIDGVEGADSFSFNAHKWFFTPLDCCCLWLKEPRHLVNALSVNAEYLRNEAAEPKRLVDYKDWQIALSHRFRAIKLWMVLRSHGVANLRNFIRSHVSMALLFEGFVEGDERFEVVVPRNFALVCFRLLLPEADLEEVNAANKRLLCAVNATGKVFMSHAVVDGIYFIRFVVAASLTEKKHVRAAWQVVQEQAEALLAELKPQATAAAAVKELAELNLHGAAVVVQEQA